MKQQLGLFSETSDIGTSSSSIADLFVPKSDFYFYCDLETSGFEHWRSDVVETALVVVDNDWNIVDRFQNTSKPSFGRGYDSETEKIHGYCYEELMQFQDQKSACIEILHFLKTWFVDGQKIPIYISCQRPIRLDDVVDYV